MSTRISRSPSPSLTDCIEWPLPDGVLSMRVQDGSFRFITPERKLPSFIRALGKTLAQQTGGVQFHDLDPNRERDKGRDVLLKPASRADRFKGVIDESALAAAGRFRLPSRYRRAEQ